MTTGTAHRVYDILVKYGGASEMMRESFVYHHTKEPICEEWRFQGKLGFGGKYYSNRNRVDTYTESYTTQREAIIKTINQKLLELNKKLEQ